MTVLGPKEVVSVDPADVRLVQSAAGVLRDFNAAGVLAAADLHVALRLGRLGGVDDGDVLLAVALAVRAPRLGHVCTDVQSIRDSATVDVDFPADLSALPWPEPAAWLERLTSSPLVATGDDFDTDRPLRLIGSQLYLDRYWREERRVAADLVARAGEVAGGVDLGVLTASLERLFTGGATDLQRLAAATAVLRRFTVVGGGPGTGKTTTVARIIALLDEQAAASGAPAPLVALAAPTGKAAARLAEAVHEQAADSDLDISDGARTRLRAMEAVTLHRLLGWRPGNRSRFKHDRTNRLPHDVVIVDETSMVSLSLMAKLVEAVRTNARLILVGDPQQLSSVEAGAVLGDVVGPAADRLLMRKPAAALLTEASGQDVPATEPPAGSSIGDGIVILRTVHRFKKDAGIATLAEAIRQGNADAVIATLQGAEGDVTWIDTDIAEPAALAALKPVQQAAVTAGQRVTEAARTGAGKEALEALGSFRLLCAHRRGPYGVATWTDRVERWLAAGVEGFADGGTWYVGRPLLITENDYALRLYNGDTGVVVQTNDRIAAVFERSDQLVQLSPNRLSAVDTVYAMTIHKSQGSQFDTVAVLLPDPTSRILTRELLYTAVTRAQSRLVLAGTEDAIRAAVERPIARASGLRDLLWGGSPDG